jgi:hypothetical protein
MVQEPRVQIGPWVPSSPFSRYRKRSCKVKLIYNWKPATAFKRTVRYTDPVKGTTRFYIPAKYPNHGTQSPIGLATIHIRPVRED